mmetsp:Transcript_92062/g.260100  ORF Transcript_92062/g.260100 Transcript_92062/m.260100 type:complete len:205 (-) Transcript_92062:186-800(-)
MMDVGLLQKSRRLARGHGGVHVARLRDEVLQPLRGIFHFPLHLARRPRFSLDRGQGVRLHGGRRIRHAEAQDALEGAGQVQSLIRHQENTIRHVYVDSAHVCHVERQHRLDAPTSESNLHDLEFVATSAIERKSRRAIGAGETRALLPAIALLRADAGWNDQRIAASVRDDVKHLARRANLHRHGVVGPIVLHAQLCTTTRTGR